jgi:MraZ protein
MHYIGRYYHALEQKGRLSIPKSFRISLGQSAVITLGLEQSLFLFSKEEWQQLASEQSHLPFTSKLSRDWVRYLANNASPIQIDSLGRALIPEHLRQAAKLEKEVVIVGSFNRIEIWDRHTYHQYFDQITKKAEAIAEAVGQVTKNE